MNQSAFYMFFFLFMTDLFMSDLFITIKLNTKDHPCLAPPYIIPPPLYKPIKNRLRKYISPGLIVGGLRYRSLAAILKDNVNVALT